MNQNIEIALKQAFSLIEAGNLDEARAILRPILESEKDNADVWWLYSHAVTDAETARLALNNVLRINAKYPDARELLEQLEAQQKNEQSDDILDIDKEPTFIPAMPSSIPGIKPLPTRGEFAGDTTPDDLPDTMFDDEEAESFFRRPVFYIPLIAILIIAALAVVILKPFAVNSPSSPTVVETSVQSSALATPTLETLGVDILTETPVTSVETSVSATPASGSDFSPILSKFGEFKLPSENGISIINTNLGNSLNLNVCTWAGKELRELLPKAMETLAKASTSYANQAQAISVRMLDCSSNSTLLWLGSIIEDATAFANGTLSDKDYQAKWKPVSS